MSFSWLSSPQGGQQQQNNHHQQPQFADVSRFQSMKHQLEHFREATDPTIAATLGFAESGFVHPHQPTNQNNNNNYNRSVSSSSQNQDPRRSMSTTSSQQQQPNRSNSVLQPPGLSPSASRGTSMDRNYNNQRQNQNQTQQTQQQQLMRPPTVIQADGSFRFVVPPPPPSGQPAPRPHLQNNNHSHYLHDDEQDPNSFHHQQQENRQQQEIQTVSLKASTNPNVMLPQRPDQHDHHHFVNQQNQQQTPGADISAIHVVNHQHNISSSATPGMTSKNLFGQQQQQNHHHDPNQQQNEEHVQEKVQVQEKPPWVGPLDQQPQQNSASASYSPRATSPAPRTGIRSSNKNRRSRSTSSCPMCESESRSSRKQKKEEVHLIQDGRRVIYKGTTHQRLTEESLYTGQSKFRFAWKQQFQPTVPVSTSFNNSDDDYDRQRQHIHEYHQQNDNSSVVVDESALYNTNNRETHHDSEEDDYYFHHHHAHHSNITTTPSAKSHTSTTTPTSKARRGGAGGRSTPIQALSVKHYSHFQQEQPKVLDLMNGTAIAAEQLRRAKTEGERRTAETLMRRQAFKALHPEVLEWKDKTWQDSLRPSAKSGRGGADNYDDAKNFSMYQRDRPQWRFPARQGPTMKELREAPMVVSLTLEDLKVTPVEERVMEHMSSQRRGRAQHHNQQNTSVNPNALVHPPKIHRADEPPPTPVSNNTPNIEMQHLQQQQQQNNINNPQQHHLSYSEKHREIQKSLPPDASSFLVREPPGLKLSKKNWSASPIPSTPKENEIPSSQQQQEILIKNQQQNSSTGGLKSTTNRSVRDVMASFGDPNKSIKDAQREQEELSGQILNELYFQREKEAKAALQQQQDHLKKVKTDNVYKYRVAARDNHDDEMDNDHYSSYGDHDEVFTNSRATSLGAVSNSIASAQLKIHNLSGAKIRAVVKDDSVYSDL